MAADRKSEYTGDRFGDWAVIGRAPAQDRKRCWHVTNTVTDEHRVVLQTELSMLGKSLREGDGQTRVIWDPFHLPADEMERLLALDAAPVGAGDCKHGTFVNDCPDCSARLGTPLPPRYEAQGADALSAQIARRAMGAGEQMMMFTYPEAVASVALSRDPDMQTYWVDTRLPVEVPEPTSTSLAEINEMFGTHYDENGSESAFYAERNPDPPVDPVRVALRNVVKLLGEVQDAVDQALKAVIQGR